MLITGRFVLCAAVAALGIVIRPQWSTVALWVVVMSAVWLFDVLSALPPATLTITRGGTTTLRAGESATLTLTLTNPGARTFAGIIRDAWPPSLPTDPSRQSADVRPGERRVLTTHIASTRRGSRFPDRVTVRSLGRWKLAGRQQSRRLPWRVDVLPAFSSRRHLPSKLAQLRDLEGRSVVLHRGQGSEFDSLREYVNGDDVRSIDWRASARVADVMVRTWRPERDRHVLIVLDCGRTSAGRVGDAPRLDAAIESTLLLTALTQRAGDRVDVVAWDRSVRGAVSGRTGTAGIGPVTSMLAHIEPSLLETDWRGLQTEIARRSRQRSLVVLLTSLDPAPVRTGVLPMIAHLTQRHLVIVAAPNDPTITAMATDRSDLASTYRAAAAAGFALERQAVSDELMRSKVEVVDALPENLAPAVTDRYLALKAAGRL